MGSRPTWHDIIEKPVFDGEMHGYRAFHLNFQHCIQNNNFGL